jgi:hypothetical protein
MNAIGLCSFAFNERETFMELLVLEVGVIIIICTLVTE